MKKSLFILVAVLLCWTGDVKAQESMENKTPIQEVQAYLSECGVFYVATVDGDQPRVRPFGVATIYDGRLYIMTGKKKDVYKQMIKNGKFEISAVKKSGAEWIRVSGVLVNDDDIKAKQYLLDKNPSLKGMYKADDDNMAVLYIINGEARFCSFMGAERKVKF